jgi:hypothetical protein
MNNHRCKANNTTSKIIIDYGDAYIELIEDYPCDNQKQLIQREGEIIKSTNNCINKCIIGRTREEYREINKDNMKKYYEDNKKEYKQVHKEYYEKNRERIREKQKEYREKNKEKIKTQQMKRFNLNKDILNEKRRQMRKQKKLVEIEDNGENNKT